MDTTARPTLYATSSFSSSTRGEGHSDSNSHPPSSSSNLNLRLNRSESPLDTLVRRTSSRRVLETGREQQQQWQEVRGGGASTPVSSYDDEQYTQQQQQAQYQYQHQNPYIYQQQQQQEEEDTDEAYAAYAYSEPPESHSHSDQPPRKQVANLRLDILPAPASNALLHSPLLHSHFARDSVATASDGNSSRIHSSSSSYMSSSGRSPTGSTHTAAEREDEFDAYGYYADDATSVYSSGTALRDSWRSTDTGATVRGPDGATGNLPSLVVSSPEQQIASRAGRAPIVKPVTANFSRPVREVAHNEHAIGERVTVQVPEDMREQKKKVLERNARRGPAMAESSRPSMESVGGGSTYVGSPQPQPQPPAMNRLHPSSYSGSTSPVSLYSNYSYYQYDSAAPSPTGSQFESSKPAPPVVVRRQSKAEVAAAAAAAAGPRTPQDYLQLGIQHHEANRLQESVRCFERSAREDGGCGVGMLMYGLALRHGWGCAKNEALGFKWVQKAAEYAVVDLERVRTGGRDVDMGAVQTELVLAIYEVGQCFFHGWGVAKDQKMGVSYYSVAARLGDADAQGDLAFCLANGKGCKKDKREAARWYRAAVQQGTSDVGLAWIYKDKYQ